MYTYLCTLVGEDQLPEDPPLRVSAKDLQYEYRLLDPPLRVSTGE